MKSSELYILGTGICMLGQITVESLARIRSADRILHAVNDPLAETVFRQLNAIAPMIDLEECYVQGLQRKEVYLAMVEKIMDALYEGGITVCIFYGHPGVMVYASHEAIQRARAEGYVAKMLPGISAEDCLFADLGVNPSRGGCLSIEATDLLFHERNIDTTSHLIIWQIGVVGDLSVRFPRYDTSNLPLLVEKLLRWYSPQHIVTVYEAASKLYSEPHIHCVPLEDISSEMLTSRSTLFVPPASPSRKDSKIMERYISPAP